MKSTQQGLGAPGISYDDLAAVLVDRSGPNGEPMVGVQCWRFVLRLRRWLRVITLGDGRTVLNAIWDRRFRP